LRYNQNVLPEDHFQEEQQEQEEEQEQEEQEEQEVLLAVDEN
jgi:hypothetical protein